MLGVGGRRLLRVLARSASPETKSLSTTLPKSKNILQLPPQTRATSQQTEFERYFSFLYAARCQLFFFLIFLFIK